VMRVVKVSEGGEEGEREEVMVGPAAAEMVEPMGERRVVSVMMRIAESFLEGGQFRGLRGSVGEEKVMRLGLSAMDECSMSLRSGPTTWFPGVGFSPEGFEDFSASAMLMEKGETGSM